MLYSVEDLVINDSFIAYCTQQNADAMAFWDNYLEQNPQALPEVEEARLLVLGLKFMLQKKQNELSANEDRTGHALYIPDTLAVSRAAGAGAPRVFRDERKWVSAVAVAAVIIMVLGLFYLVVNPLKETTRKGVERIASTAKPVFSQPGELKTVVLPDNTTITLNAGSYLELSKDFGTKNRDIYLKGEALFNVTHNKNLPFVVHVKSYKVRVLGTRFNIKAYTNDAVSETSLLEGSVQILLNRQGKDEVYKTLKVNQKFVIKTDSAIVLNHADDKLPAEVEPLSYYDEKQNIETAWANDLLIFDGRSMEEIKNVLERKFNTTIVIADDEVRSYTYSANFTNESIDDILKALRLSYPFNYKKEGNTIIINK